MKKLLDLRFVIGIFFAVIGTLLIIYGLITGENKLRNTSVNTWSAFIFLLFGIGMIVLSYTNHVNEDGNQE